MNRHPLALTFLIVALPGVLADASARQEEPTRSIVNVTGDLYRAQNNNHYNVFLVTSEGIILTDPINRDFSTWLRSELEDRFDVPVRYVLYSHHHWDHASGGAVFADTAEFIGHESMPGALALPGGDPPLPENVRDMDTNGNGLIERHEATGVLLQRFDLIDMNGDGALSGAEVMRGALNDVHPPTITYSDRYTVTLGGRSAVLIHTGVAHAPDMAVIHFPEERVVFGADLLQARRLVGNLSPTLGAYADAYRTIVELDFDIAATGHADNGTRRDIMAQLHYLESLAVGVARGIAEGRSLQEIQASLHFDASRDWDRYDTQRLTHIAQVYAMLKGSGGT